jgi:hypothetical protein
VKVAFPDGQVATLTIGLAATVGQLRRWLREVRADLAPGRLKLAVAMPPTPLDDDSVTVEAAGLKMAQIRVNYA